MDENDEKQAHRYFAIETFNGAWELIEKAHRTPDDDAEMLQRVFTSRWHWGFVGAPEQFATGDWQIAHVASLLGYGWMAQFYARRAFAICENEGWSDWRRASMLEGMARAAAAAGDELEHAQYYELAEAAVASIAEEGERAVIASQLATVPKP
jgi:hypothetical protein